MIPVYPNHLGGYDALYDNHVIHLIYVAKNVWAVKNCQYVRGNTPRRAAEAYVMWKWKVKP